MKKIIYLIILIIIILIGGIIYLVTSITWSGEARIINLSTPSDSKWVLFETDKVIISLSYNDFELALNNLLKIYPSEETPQKILNFIREKTQQNEKINLKEVPELMKSVEQLILPDFLESGNFILFDKKNNKYINSIKIENFSKGCRLCNLGGTGGKRYIIPESNTIFLERIEWVS